MEMIDQSLQCSECSLNVIVDPGCTLQDVKDRIATAAARHFEKCGHEYSSYALFNGNIVLSCDYCGQVDYIFSRQ